MKTGKTALSN